jgi:hypothetical protein
VQPADVREADQDPWPGGSHPVPVEQVEKPVRARATAGGEDRPYAGPAPRLDQVVGPLGIGACEVGKPWMRVEDVSADVRLEPPRSEHAKPAVEPRSGHRTRGCHHRDRVTGS